MTKFLAPETVVEALHTLTQCQFKRVGRTALLGFLLLKAKEPNPGDPIEVSTRGPLSVAGEIERFLRIAPGTPNPDVNPFGSHDGHIEYLAKDYERRGTYTQLYPGRALTDFLTVERSGRVVRVRIPEGAAEAVADRLGALAPLLPTAAFLLRNEPFSDTATPTDVVDSFKRVFHLSDDELTKLFQRTPFKIDFAPTPFPNDLKTLPADLQPKTQSTTHAATERAGRVLVPLARRETREIVVDETLTRRLHRAFIHKNAIALVGPPGTGKSQILTQVMEDAADEPAVLGLKRAPKYLMVTADADWTARTIIGGYFPQENGRLEFRDGYLLQAIRNDQILFVDEMNRADLDRVLGPILTFLAKQPVDLGVTHLGAETEGAKPKKIVLAWAQGGSSGVKEDEDQRVYYAGTDWRIVGTYNNTDRGRVFPMGSALQRRWALIPVAPVSTELARQVLDQSGLRAPVVDVLVRAYEFHLLYLSIGLAPFLDIADYVGDEVESGSPDITDEERRLLGDGYVMFMGQQLARLDPEKRTEFFNVLASLFGSQLADEAARF